MASTAIMDTQGFVTPEAVELDLPAANVGLRICSALIDLVITFIILCVGFWLVGTSAFVADIALLQALIIIALVGSLVAVPVCLETIFRGRTVGKMALGLRTVRDDAGPIGFRHAFIRGLLTFVEVWLSVGVIALVVSITNTKGKRLGDYLAGTYVVRDRIKLTLGPAPQADPLLEDWARGADMAGLPDALTVAVRQLLARSATMTPQSFAMMSGQLFSNVMEHVSPPPPGGAPQLAVMATVLAERRRRDVLRVGRHDQVRANVLGPDPLAISPLPHRAPPHTPAG